MKIKRAVIIQPKCLPRDMLSAAIQKLHMPEIIMKWKKTIKKQKFAGHKAEKGRDVFQDTMKTNF